MVIQYTNHLIIDNYFKALTKKIQFEKNKNYKKFSIFTFNVDQKFLKTILFQFNNEDVGIKKNLPYGIFSHAKKITNEWDLKGRWEDIMGDIYYNWGEIELSSNYLRVSYMGFGGSDEDAAAIKGDFEVFSTDLFIYFEIKILSSGREGFIGIGLAHKDCDLDRLPGWELYSFGYHADDGHLFNCSGSGNDYGPRFSKGDVIGLCWNLIEKTIFFTKNGTGLPFAFRNYFWYNLPLMYPVIGLRSEGEKVVGNFGDTFFEFDIETYFNSFTKNFALKINLVGEIEFMKEFENKIKQFNGFSPKRGKFFKRKFTTNTLINDIVTKKKIKKISDFHIFNFKNNNKRIGEINSLAIQIFPKIFIRVLKIFTIPLKSGYKYFDVKPSVIKQRSIKSISNLFSNYWANLLFKNNYNRKYKNYLVSFSTKKNHIIQILGGRKIIQDIPIVLRMFTPHISHVFSFIFQLKQLDRK